MNDNTSDIIEKIGMVLAAHSNLAPEFGLLAVKDFLATQKYARTVTMLMYAQPSQLDGPVSATIHLYPEPRFPFTKPVRVSYER